MIVEFYSASNIFISDMEDFSLNYEGSDRLEGFNKPRVWTIMNNLAVQTGSVNLVKSY